MKPDFLSGNFNLLSITKFVQTEGKMSGKYIIGSIVATGAATAVVDHVVSDRKVFGGSTPGTVATSEWWEATDRKFQAWPRTAGPPVEPPQLYCQVHGRLPMSTK